tara:strand:- start:118 stop:774 length:657 start_codon:yes stop_codon:yes gene_type:complete
MGDKINLSKTRIKNLNKEVFFILSTARCRSSWFGNFFTYKDSFCYNEELRFISNWDELIERIERRPEKYVGFEDPELLHYIETLYELFPNATYVLLERDRPDAEMSLGISGDLPSHIVTQKFDRWYEDIEKFKEVVGEYRRIHFNDMDDLKSVKNIWEYVLPNSLFDIDRWNMLIALPISITLERRSYPTKESSMAPYLNFTKLFDARNRQAQKFQEA